LDEVQGNNTAQLKAVLQMKIKTVLRTNSKKFNIPNAIIFLDEIILGTLQQNQIQAFFLQKLKKNYFHLNLKFIKTSDTPLHRILVSRK
jgi:hypothetical protein